MEVFEKKLLLEIRIDICYRHKPIKSEDILWWLVLYDMVLFGCYKNGGWFNNFYLPDTCVSVIQILGIY